MLEDIAGTIHVHPDAERGLPRGGAARARARDPHLMGFRAPVRDIAFALKIAGLDHLLASGAFPDLDSDICLQVLTAAGSFAEEVLAPLNRVGDTEGARFENGRVFAAPGFADAYRQYIAGGWTSLAAAPDFGGQGLPRAIALAVFEMVTAANMGFGLCPMLSEAGIELLTAHGTPRQKQVYLPKLVSGEWTGTMNLTEPQAGSDLGADRTRAEPDGDGGYRITGQKIFITWGDHDLADNIVPPGAGPPAGCAAGHAGHLACSWRRSAWSDADGSAGRAPTRCGRGIEHKLGIHASPTCVMLFEGAEAELVGAAEPGAGADVHHDERRAAERRRGGRRHRRARLQQALDLCPGAAPGPLALDRGRAGAPSSTMPDVRRMLLLMKAKIEAARAICLSTAVAADLGEHAPTTRRARPRRLREELLVPIAKAWSTDVGVEVASLGVQVHGGMGFIEETGAAQHYRDARIAPIYEGTNGIQAIDLAGRKLSLAGGHAMRALLTEMRSGLPDLDGPVSKTLGTAIAAAERATDWLILNRGSSDALAGATAYLKLLGDVVGGWQLARAAAAAPRLADKSYARGKLALARLYASQVLTSAPGLADAVCAGAAELEAGAAALFLRWTLIASSNGSDARRKPPTSPIRRRWPGLLRCSTTRSRHGPHANCRRWRIGSTSCRGPGNRRSTSTAIRGGAAFCRRCRCRGACGPAAGSLPGAHRGRRRDDAPLHHRVGGCEDGLQRRHGVRYRAPRDRGAERSPALIEEQDIVYREASKRRRRGAEPRRRAADARNGRALALDTVLLFRYSALTFNGHRIHYDREYCREAEGYPGLVVHGPFTATLLADHFLRQAPGARLAALQFRAQRPLFDTAPFALCGARTLEGADLWAQNPSGETAMSLSLTCSA